MNLGDLLTPWLLLASVLIPLIYAEKWIHSHLYGVGWLLTHNHETATTLYYFFLAPGVFVHEVVQWLVSGALYVETKQISIWPEPQEDGSLRLDFVQIDLKRAGWLKSAIIGASPFVVGITLVGFISNRILNLENFINSLGTGDITVIGSAVKDLGSTPDFYLWLYLMFAISNAMLPTPADRRGWPLVIGMFAGIIAFLVLIGVGDKLMETFTGPVAHAVDTLTTALTTVLVVELFAIVFVGFIEEVLERLTKRKFQYRQPTEETPRRREPGSNLPLDPDEPLPSILNLELPIPDPREYETLVASVRRKPVPDAVTPGAAMAAQEPGLRRPLEPARADLDTDSGRRDLLTTTRRDEMTPGAETDVARRTPDVPRAPGPERTRPDMPPPGERRPLPRPAGMDDMPEGATQRGERTAPLDPRPDRRPGELPAPASAQEGLRRPSPAGPPGAPRRPSRPADQRTQPPGSTPALRQQGPARQALPPDRARAEPPGPPAGVRQPDLGRQPMPADRPRPEQGPLGRTGDRMGPPREAPPAPVRRDLTGDGEQSGERARFGAPSGRPGSRQRPARIEPVDEIEDIESDTDDEDDELEYVDIDDLL